MSNVKRIFISSALEKINEIQALDRLTDEQALDALEALHRAIEQASKLAGVISERTDDQVAREGSLFFSNRLAIIKDNVDAIYIDLALRV